LLNKLNKIDIDCHCITTRCCHPCRNENFGRIEEERNYWMGIVFKEEKYRCASISKSQWEALEKGLNVPIFHEGVMFPRKTMIIKMSDYETPE